MDSLTASSSASRSGMACGERGIRFVAGHVLLFAISFGIGPVARVGAQAAVPDDLSSRLPSSKSASARAPKQVDFSDWSAIRIKAYSEALGAKFPKPMATVSVPRLHLRAPLFEGVDDLTLDRGVGRVPGTSLPGQDGNLAIAGHRDGFFRQLKDIQKGDFIEIAMFDERDVYVVDSTTIVEPSDISVLKPKSKPTLTLVTCYPFYFIGHAPQRFIVEAHRVHRLSEPLPRPASAHGGP